MLLCIEKYFSILTLALCIGGNTAMFSLAATFLTLALLLCLVGATASLVPARRAARVDPLRALRSE